MVEASLPTFRTFCEHHDVSSLFADQAYLHQYEQVVRAYATFASTRKNPGKDATSKPVAMRWRNAGLEAIKSVAESEALSSVAGRQLDVVVPMILENLWTDSEDFLDILHRRVELEEQVDSNALLHRRTSISTVKTAETGGDANPIAISGSSTDIDKLAEEDIGVMAMQCLKQIFVIPNRAQINGATTALLRFIKERVQQKEGPIIQSQDNSGRDRGWAIKIFEFIATWAPVQDRYVIVITATDALLRTAPTDENVADQIVLSAIVGSLLSSDINLIGLSVMDVLLGLIQHMKRVLKHSGGSRGSASGTASGDEKPSSVPDPSQHISGPHKELLARIQQSIGNLATHVYYADQISDMISSILIRLKPHPSTTASTSSPVAEKGEAPPGASIGNISDDQTHLDGFFALDMAKTIALQAVKSILLVANPNTKISGNVTLTRNKVPLRVWEGTHWLLRDPDGQVRKAYVDAVTTWLDRETTAHDLEARDDMGQKQSRANKEQQANVARRAVSNASTREKPSKVTRSHYLQLLHLAIYENALQFIEYEADIAILHILLTKLVNKLGVNAARYGLPVVFRLQEDIPDVETPLSKVHLGCLCHGYFWALSEHFEFEASPIGRAIHNEITRRRSKHFWVEGVHIPTPLLEDIGNPGTSQSQAKMPSHEVESETILPFDDRTTMVECICAKYKERAISPPASPATSPGRVFAHNSLSSPLSTIPPADDDHELPDKFREEMVAEWNREAALLALQVESKTASLSGSKTGTTATKGNHLTVGGLGANGYSSSRPESAYARQTTLRPASRASHAAVLRNSSMQSHGSARSASSRGFVASVDQLKSALTGEPARPGTFHTLREDDDSSESMASYEFSPSELSFSHTAADGADGNDTSLGRSRSKSRERKASTDSGGPLTSHPTEGDAEDDEYVPPVPPLPPSLKGKSPPLDRNGDRIAKQDHALKSPRRNLRSRGGDSFLSNNFANAGAASLDLQAMLKGIDSKSKQNTLGNLTKPPY